MRLQICWLLTILLVVVCVSSQGLDLSQWMGLDQVKSKSLSEITLLGSHDSASFSVDGKNVQGNFTIQIVKGIRSLFSQNQE